MLQLFAGRAKTARIATIVIVLFHAIGLIGFLLPGIDTFFLSIVPWHLLLMAAVIFYSHDKPDVRFLLFIVIVFLLGFCAELVGVHTGWLFGSYSYGETLGVKVLKVPVTIGINWLLLVYSTGVLMQLSRIKSVYIRILVGAAILVLLDFLIEPVAIHFDYWHWTLEKIPLTNYACWFILSAVMLFIFDSFKFKHQSKAAPALLISQFVFFLILGLMN